jgi:hypothetical protein
MYQNLQRCSESLTGQARSLPIMAMRLRRLKSNYRQYILTAALAMIYVLVQYLINPTYLVLPRVRFVDYCGLGRLGKITGSLDLSCSS